MIILLVSLVASSLFAIVALGKAENKIHLLEIDLEDSKREIEHLSYYLDLVNASFSLDLNMNDTFDYNLCDSESLSEEHILELRPYFEKYGFYSLIAYVSLKRDMKPIPPIADNENFKSALAELSIDDIFND